MDEKDIRHRWLTQRELDEMIEQARREAVAKARREIRDIAWNHTKNETLDCAIAAYPLSEVWSDK